MCKKFICLTTFVLLAGLVGNASAWHDQTIGTQLAGSASYNAGTSTWTVTGDGDDIWNATDNFHFVYKYLQGDGSITARVATMAAGTSEWGKAGVMMRETLTGPSTDIYNVKTVASTGGTAAGGGGSSFQWRLTTSAGCGNTDYGSAVPPLWVRVVRSGDSFTGYSSTDGTTWTLRGAAQTVAMRGGISGGYVGCYIGLCVTSHAAGELRTATFDNITFTGNITDLPPPQLKAFAPIPADGAKNMAKSVIQWSPGDTAAAHDVYFGTSQTAVTNATPDSDEYIEQTNLLYCALVTGLQKEATTYYWRIDEVEEGGTIQKGDVWSYTTASFKAHTPVPADGWPFADPNLILSWGPGFNVKTTSGHRVYFGTDATAVANATTSTAGIYKGAKSSPGYATGVLPYNATYYWRIDEVNKDATVTKGDVWRFKTRRVSGGLRAEYHHWSGTSPPSRAAAFSNLRLTRLDPVINFSWGDPGSPDPVVNPDLFSGRWVGEIEIPFTETYTFTSASDDGFRLWVNEQLIIDAWWDQGTTEHSGTIALTGGQRYTIQAEYYENGGGAVAQLYWASPSIARAIIPEAALSPPVRATRADPADDAVGVEDTPTLKWAPGMKALKHDVYFGTDETAVTNATTATAGIYKGRIDPNKYDIVTPLVWGKEYFWRIDEVNTVNPESPWKGSVWSFTVADYLIVDEFEDYNDYTPK